jgi:hypothetical protein
MNQHERRSAKAKARRRRGRPKGSTVPLERDRQKFAIAVWGALRLYGAGPYVSAYWAAVVTGDEPIKPEDVEGLLTDAGIDIKRTASSLDEHIHALVRKAKRTISEQANNRWLEASSLAIKALILAARTANTEVYCGMLDVLIDLGWRDVIARLTARIDDLAKSNVPPHEGKLGRQGQTLLDWLRSTMEVKT